MISLKMKRQLLPCLLLTAAFSGILGQTTTIPPLTTLEPYIEGLTTTHVSTTVEQGGGTTLTAADSAAPTTTVAADDDGSEATTEGQESYNRFESTRTKPFDNLEVTTPTPNRNSNGQLNDKNIEKKTAWKFGRGGNSQGGWSIGPIANNGYPLWQKGVPLPGGPGPEVGGAVDANGKNNDQQAYIVWSVGQGSPPNGWSLNGGSEGWPPAGTVPDNAEWNQGDATGDGNAGAAGWNAGEWSDDQPANDEDPQEGWAEEEGGAPEDNTEGEWTNTAPGGWNPPNGNAASLENGQPPPPVEGNAPPPGWTPQGDAPVGSWDGGSSGQVINNGGGGWETQQPVQQNGGNGWAQPQPVQKNGGNGWTPPQPVQQNGGNGWTPPQPVQQNSRNGFTQPKPILQNGGNGWTPPQPVPQNGGNGWVPTPKQTVGGPPVNSAQGGWSASNGGEWNNPQPPNPGPATWNNAAPVVGWSDSQKNGGSFNPYAQGGIQDPEMSWKVYNEDTHTMENLDDNSGWKVVGDGGPDGWKLVNENGNIEWKIENVNGEWKVVSADDLPSQNNTTPSNEETNTTTVSSNMANDTMMTTTLAPSWDDTKQGRYIVWKFSENGKGEARVFNGDGAEPVVWTVGDNQYWKETVGLNPSDNMNNNNNNNNAKANWATSTRINTNSGSTSSTKNNGWNGNNGSWQNSAQKPNAGTWQNSGASNPPQNSGWQADGGGGTWQNGGQSAPKSNGWQAGGQTAPVNSNWQAGGQNAPPGNKWNNGNLAAPAPTNPNWQAKGPGSPTNTNWQNGGPAPSVSAGLPSQPPNGRGWQAGSGVQQNGRKNKVVTAPQTNSWANSNPNTQTNGGWQNQSPTAANGWNRGNTSPQTSVGWQNTGSINQTPSPQTGWKNGGNSQSNSGWTPRGNGRKNQGKTRAKNQSKRGRNSNGWQPNKSSNKNNAQGTWNNKNGGNSWNQGNAATTQGSWNGGVAPSVAPAADNSNVGAIPIWQNTGNKASTTVGWPGVPQTAAGQNGQTVPYIIVIKQPDVTATGGAPNSWSNNGNNVNTKKPKSRNGNKPKNNRRGNGFKMNPAGSSGWQWNPQGGSGGWKWTDGWMGSGGGYGGWVSDKGTMYSGWRPTKTNSTPSNAQPKRQTGSGPRSNKKNGGKMVFVFGSKRNSSGGGQNPNTNGRKKGRQVIILDYTGSNAKGENGLNKDIESVIQALRSAKAAGSQGTAVWKRGVQPQNQQQWGR